MKRISAFPPIIQESSRVLVLGSMPGKKSLEAQQYYAHPQNQFWTIMGLLFETEIPTEYTERTRFLLEHRIGLWDVIHTCVRPGSLDASIREETANDFDDLFQRFAGIRLVVFNGTKAWETFRKQVGFQFQGIAYHRLPSTSPAHTMKLTDKLKYWQILREALDQLPMT